MSYFSPYIDDTGLHLPTYEDRLADLAEAYRNIFGIEAELSESVPDYQLLSVFAKALDDTSALCLQAYNSRNPLYASGNALDLLLPQYGLTRQAGETDAFVRNRIRHALAGKGGSSYDALYAAVRNARSVKDAKLYINETDTADSVGIPGHSLAVVVRGGNAQAVAQAIWDKKAPGIGLYGLTSAEAVDADGNSHTIPFTRYTDKMINVYLFIRVLPDGSQTAISDAVIPAVTAFIDQLGIAASLNVPQLYGVAYTADPSIANTFIVNDIQVAAPGASTVIRDKVDCAWNQKITALQEAVEIRFS